MYNYLSIFFSLKKYLNILMEESEKIKARRLYMRNYYLENKERYKKGIYTPKSQEPKFKIIRKEVIISFE